MAALVVERDPLLWLSRSWTTRPRREGEPEEAYFFVSEQTFTAAVSEGRFLEWTRFGNHLYGTPLPNPPPGRDVLLEINVDGAKQVRARRPDALLLFLDAPSESAQSNRLRTRGDSEDHVRTRIEIGPEERGIARNLGAIMVVNEEINETAKAMIEIISRYRDRYSKSLKLLRDDLENQET